MNLKDALAKTQQTAKLTAPELRYLQAAAERVRERWPDVQVSRIDKERETLAQKLRHRVETGDWEDTRLSLVVAAASAVFDEERRERPDLAQTRDFLYAEIAASTSETFLAGLLRVYLESYALESPHTKALASALGAATKRMNRSCRFLLEALPELIDTRSGPDSLADRMSRMSEPYMELLRLGLRNPHGSGFMDFAHRSLTTLIRPHLSERNLIDWYIRWLRPAGKEQGRNTGAEPAIEALIHPWLKDTPEDKLRSHLVETLIELYGDPRIKSGGVWGGIDERYLAIVYRWLTREDMRFFTGVVDATQKDAMWPPRRDFWLKLYDEGKIDAAWAALSKQGFEYARQHLMREDAKNSDSRVGFQAAGGSRRDTSLLVMKVGNKIMVDGCHNYRTHVFDAADPMAPQLFKEGYNCDEIMRASDDRQRVAARGHHPIHSWSRWVRDMINADVPWSQQTRAYTKVFRPRPPKPRYQPSTQPWATRYSGRQIFARPVDSSTASQDLIASTGLVRSPSDSRLVDPVRPTAAPSANVAASRRVHADFPEPAKHNSFGSAFLKQTRFASLTDQLIACGPGAAEAVLAYLEEPAKGRTGPALSPKSREGLAWVRAPKGELPLRLRNSLEYLLLNLKTSGVDLDVLFASSSDYSQPPAASPSDEILSNVDRASHGAILPPLPDNAQARLELICDQIDALFELAYKKGILEQRKSLGSALRRIKERRFDLRPAEIGDVLEFYEELRQGNKGSRK
jgi:hypothetical protein